jgi:signal peptidase I
MRNNRLIINGNKVEVEPITNSRVGNLSTIKVANKNLFKENLSGRQHPVMFTPEAPSARSFGPIIVPEGKFFMMGDNRDNSADSRYFGFVERSLVVGRATSVVISLDINNKYQPRWPRFFKKLP